MIKEQKWAEACNIDHFPFKLSEKHYSFLKGIEVSKDLLSGGKMRKWQACHLQIFLSGYKINLNIPKDFLGDKDGFYATK